MNKLNGKTIAALAGATVLATTGAAAVPMAAQAVDTNIDTASTAAQVLPSQSSEIVRVSNVQGEFSYSQDTLTPSYAIASVFMKTAAAQCASATNEVIGKEATPIAVGGDVANSYVATVPEMADSKGATSYIMGCTCASNGPGGGAVANAQVEGVSLESVYAQAQKQAGQI